MQIETLISHLQAIAAKYPGIHVIVAELSDYTTLQKITDIVTDKPSSQPGGYKFDIWLSCELSKKQPFDINKF